MQVVFRTKKLEKCYRDSKYAIRQFGGDVARRFIERINIIRHTKTIEELQALPGLRCHPLKGNRKDQWAVNLTGYYRLIFTLRGDDLDIVRIEEVSKHYED